MFNSFAKYIMLRLLYVVRMYVGLTSAIAGAGAAGGGRGPGGVPAGAAAAAAVIVVVVVVAAVGAGAPVVASAAAAAELVAARCGQVGSAVSRLRWDRDGRPLVGGGGGRGAVSREGMCWRTEW